MSIHVVRTNPQLAASDPRVSAWVTANAGTGKTYVLTQRVARLLLDGTEPDKILCLTYTKAAASEMAERLFGQLSEWTVISDQDLISRLEDFVGTEHLPGSLHRARRLFAQALEAPGGLKIQTIHAFCERLLRRFPLESGVSPDFQVLDEFEANKLQIDAMDAAVLALSAPENLDGQSALDYLMRATHESELVQLSAAILSAPERFLDVSSGRVRPIELLQELVSAHGIAEDETPSSFVEAFADDLSSRSDHLMAIAAQWREGTTQDQNRAAILQAASQEGLRAYERTELYCDALLKKDREPFKNLHTKKLATQNSNIVQLLDKEEKIALRFVRKRAALSLKERTLALIHYGAALCNHYAQRKKSGSFLDYRDLIEKTNLLLSNTTASQWVLYKLDGGIDHILVDEAQDTSPDQWNLIEKIASEFFAGQGAWTEHAPDLVRTIFAVGDEKQSIYSFQGADPKKFLETHEAFSERAGEAELEFSSVTLSESRRSTSEVLALVDQVFSDPQYAAQITQPGQKVLHEVFRENEPGLVEFWPLVRPPAREPDLPWDAPLDQEHESQAHCILAARIADQIKTWLQDQEWLPSQNRPIKPSDIFILVQRRGVFFEEMIRALKRRSVPVAGSDRLKLTEHIAVMDLIAAGSFVLLPEDDLNLAALLKSPLIGVSEDELFQLAYDRGGASLWHAMNEAVQKEPDTVFARAEMYLRGLLNRVDLERPFEFFSFLLSQDCPAGGEAPLNGWQALVSRLGREAEDPISEFLSAALEFESRQVPSMQHFIQHLSSSSPELKREVDQDSDEVRVMTVHGSKGLQSRIVFMPDTCYRANARQDPKILGAGSQLYWVGASTEDVPITSALRAAAASRREAEHLRLLYVAMTRAQDRLYISGYSGQKKVHDAAWYTLIEQAIDKLGVECELPWNETGKRIDFGTEKITRGDHPSGPLAPTKEEDLPDFLRQRAVRASVPALITPSQVGAPSVDGGSAPLSLERESAQKKPLLIGQLVHKLLQYLPAFEKSVHEERARVYLESVRGAGLERQEIDSMIAKVLSVLENREWADLFGEHSRPEVSIRGNIQVGEELIKVSGQIDRLVIKNNTVKVIDYKTNRNPPSELHHVPVSYVNQMAVYRAALKNLYPKKEILSFLLWTDGPKATELPPDLLESRMKALEQQISERSKRAMVRSQHG